MSNIPKISVITACYNHGKFINEMLESVFKQTFEDYELIIVNDGSTDNTAEILSGISNEKIKIIHSDNHGPSTARNIAIAQARASVIMNLDADDMIASDLLEKVYEVFCRNPNAGIVHCDAQCFGARTGKFEIGEYSLTNMLYDNRINSQSFFRKEDWERIGGYSNELIYGMEDWDFWLCIIELGRDVIKIPEMLIYYRTYERLTESRSGRRKSDRLKAMESQVIIFRRHKKLYSGNKEAFDHFSGIERKLTHENFAVRKVKNLLYRYVQKYYWKLAGIKFYDVTGLPLK